MDDCVMCDPNNSPDNLHGSEGVIFKDNKYYLHIEHFRNEVIQIEIKFCPTCGDKLL